MTAWIAATVAIDTGAGRLQFTIVPARRHHLDRPQHAFVPGDVVAEQRKERRQQSAPAPQRVQLTPYFDCGLDAGEIEVQLVVRACVIVSRMIARIAFDVHILPRLPDAVRQLAQPFAQQPLGLRDQRRGHAVERSRCRISRPAPCSRSRATLLQAIIERMSSATISGDAHHVEEGVEHVAADVPCDRRSAMPGEENPSVKMSRASGEKPPGIHGADVVDVDEARRPGDQLAFEMDRRDEIDVRRVQRRGVGIVQQIHVALVDVALEAANDRLARLRRAGQVVQEADAAHQQPALGV